MIEKRGDQWCLLTSDGSKVLGCHDSQAGAEAQEGAIKSRENSQDVFTIPGVQIFRTGKWNGDSYTEQDLDAMVEAFAQVGFGVPIKNGHSDDRGAPALGWVENLRRKGQGLYADLIALPKKVYDAIRQRSYDRVSAEIYWDLERNGRKFPRALKALALLGAEIPAVDLEPLSAFLSFNSMPALPSGRFAAYAVEISADLQIPREVIAKICPSCAEEMKAKGISRLKVPKDAAGVYKFDEVFKNYQSGFTEALCEKFGEADGFRTACLPEMAPHVEDAAAFCNALKDWCGEMSQHDPTVKTTSTPENKTMEPQNTGDGDSSNVSLKDGEIVVKLSEIRELRTQAAAAKDVPTLKRELQRVAAAQTELEAAQREERIRFKVMSLKIPAFRAFARVFYDLALQAPEAKTYSIADPKKTMSAETVVEEWIREMNRQSEQLFRTMSVNTSGSSMDPNEPDEVSPKVEYRVKSYQRTHPQTDYRTALVAVLDADPELKEAYRQS